MYKVIHVHHEEDLEIELNNAADEGYLLEKLQCYEGAELFHYIAVLSLLDFDEEFELEEDGEDEPN